MAWLSQTTEAGLQEYSGVLSRPRLSSTWDGRDFKAPTATVFGKDKGWRLSSKGFRRGSCWRFCVASVSILNAALLSLISTRIVGLLEGEA